MSNKKNRGAANESEEASQPEAQEPENVSVRAESVKPDSDSRASNLIRAGRPTSVCRCGEPMVRPSSPKNSTWRCLRVWNGNATPDCQKGIPTAMVLDADQVEALIKNRKDRYADAQDVG